MVKNTLKRLAGAIGLVVSFALLAGAGTAAAEVQCTSCRAWWGINSGSLPRNLSPGGEGEISLIAENYGDTGVSSQVVLVDRLPASLTVQNVAIGFGVLAVPYRVYGEIFCATQAHEVTCTLPAELADASLGVPYSFVEAFIKVKVAQDAKSGEVNDASVSGGAPRASSAAPITVDPAPTPFGVERYELRPETADGSPDTQAGSHPSSSRV
jgi:hypothetical protein